MMEVDNGQRIKISYDGAFYVDNMDPNDILCIYY